MRLNKRSVGWALGLPTFRGQGDREEPARETGRRGKWRKRTDWEPNEPISRKYKAKSAFSWAAHIYQDMPKWGEGNRRSYVTSVPLATAILIPSQEYVIQQPFRPTRELKQMHAMMIPVTGCHRNVTIATEL